MKTKSSNAAKSRSGTSAEKKVTKSKASKQNGTEDETASGLHELFEDMLKDIYWAEKALTKAIPKMIKQATAESLVTALEEHLSVTEEQVARVEQVFEAIGKKAQAKKCEAMEGLIKEAQEVMENTEAGMVRDAGIIAAAQKVEHYEIASYGTLAAFAKTLGEDEAVTLLEQTLEEEKEADHALTDVAQSTVNIQAAGKEQGEEDGEEDEDGEDTTATRSRTSTGKR